MLRHNILEKSNVLKGELLKNALNIHSIYIGILNKYKTALYSYLLSPSVQVSDFKQPGSLKLWNIPKE